jgi:hypothetical protein
MPYYGKPNILFIHIPKTGGTVIENEIKKIYEERLFNTNRFFLENILDPPYNSITPQHQFYTTIYKYRDILNINFNKIKTFTVVRNPYDRIISDLLWSKKINEKNNSREVYEIIINKYIFMDNLDNHNKPQYKFITDENLNLIPNIKIFYCERLNDTNNELNDFLGFDINIKQENVNKDYSKFLNEKSIKLINDIYKKDFELFNYTIIDC